MTIVCRVLAVAAISLAASLSAQAEEGDKSGAQSAPIPTLHCEFKSVNACSPDDGHLPAEWAVDAMHHQLVGGIRS